MLKNFQSSNLQFSMNVPIFNVSNENKMRLFKNWLIENLLKIDN